MNMNEVGTMPVARHNIDTCSMIVEFNASVWTARKLDRNVSAEVTDGKSAARDAARVNKNLMAGRTELAEIISQVNATRIWANSRTLPWSDNGQRCLPVTTFMDFEAQMKVFEQVFWDKVHAFVAVYPSLVTAQAMSLGTMFNRDEYPMVTELPSKFSFAVNYLPMPTAGHFLVDIGNAAQVELQAKLTELADKRVEAAIGDVRTRLKEHLLHMSDRLGLDTVGGEVHTKKFKDSLIENGLELCDLIKGLNIIQDPDVEAARKQLEGVLLGVTPKELRKDMDIRKDVKSEVESILSRFKF